MTIIEKYIYYIKICVFCVAYQINILQVYNKRVCSYS